MSGWLCALLRARFWASNPFRPHLGRTLSFMLSRGFLRAYAKPSRRFDAHLNLVRIEGERVQAASAPVRAAKGIAASSGVLRTAFYTSTKRLTLRLLITPPPPPATQGHIISQHLPCLGKTRESNCWRLWNDVSTVDLPLLLLLHLRMQIAMNQACHCYLR
jgi:hypothetical protein